MPDPLRTSLKWFVWLLPVFLLGIACGEKKQRMDTPPDEITFTKEGELRILKADTDSLLAVLDIEIADTEYETQTGLMYRKDMEPTQGMLFVFETTELHSFYMKNTLIPLDLIFIDEDLRIVTLYRDAQPLDESGIPSRVPVKYVLEVKGGMSNRWGIREGDRISYEKAP